MVTSLQVVAKVPVKKKYISSDVLILVFTICRRRRSMVIVDGQRLLRLFLEMERRYESV